MNTIRSLSNREALSVRRPFSTLDQRNQRTTMSFDFRPTTEPPPTKLRKKAPPAEPYDGPRDNQNFEPKEMIKNCVTNVSIEFSTQSTAPTRDRCAALFATFQQGDKLAMILPWKDNTNDNPINSGSSVPHSVDEFAKCFIKSNSGRNMTKHHVRIQTSMPFHKVKNQTHVMHHLTKWKIWMKAHDVQSSNAIPTVWLHNVNPNHTSRYEITATIKKLLPNGFDKFQIHRRTVYYHRDREISTNAWALELDASESAANVEMICEHLPITGAIGAVPMNSSDDTGGHLKKLFFSHNAFLHATAAIRVDNVHNLDAKIALTDGTTQGSIKEQLSTIKHKGEPLFLGFSQFNSKRATFLCKKKIRTCSEGSFTSFYQ